MKIALVSQTVTPGLLIFRKDLIVFLVSQGHEVYAYANDYSPDTKQSIIDLGAFPVEYSLSRVGFNVFNDVLSTISLAKSFRKFQIDSVFSFFAKPIIYATIAAKISGATRAVVMYEGLGFIHTRTSSGFSYKKRLLQFAHGILVTISSLFANELLFLNSDDLKDLSSRAFLSKHKLRVIGPIGLPISEYSFSPVKSSGTINFLLIGRLLAEKGIFEYIEAAKVVKQNYSNVKFFVVGGMDSNNPASLSKPELDRLIEENIISFPGYVNNIVDWIDRSHVFVLPSYREGFPRATQEAMAIGRPIITTDVPGCRETVTDGVNGFLVPPFDAKTLAEKMIYFIRYPEEISRMGFESHSIALNCFDQKNINPLLEQIIIGDLK